MFEFFVAEAHERLQRDLIPHPVILAEFENLGVDEAFDEAKYIRIGADLHLNK
jgi:hypothetical protein